MIMSMEKTDLKSDQTRQEIPARYPDVDLLLIHLGGTSIPGAKAPLLMVVSRGPLPSIYRTLGNAAMRC